jgi:hypothetical protein
MSSHLPHGHRSRAKRRVRLVLFRCIDSTGRSRAYKIKFRCAWPLDDDGYYGAGVFKAGDQWVQFDWSDCPDGDFTESAHRPISEAEAWVLVTTSIQRRRRWPRDIQRLDAAVRRGEVLRQLPPAVKHQWAARHSDDFRSVDWFGVYYSFSEGQSLVVQYLWEQCLRGTPEVSEKLVRGVAESASDRLSDLFQKKGGKNHPAWRSMIGQGFTKGTVRLVLPPGESETSLQPLAKKNPVPPQNTTLRTMSD